MIVFAGSRLKATDNDGNTQSIKVIGPEQDTLKVGNDELSTLLMGVIKELRILNLHMTFITDNYITKNDIPDIDYCQDL